MNTKIGKIIPLLVLLMQATGCTVQMAVLPDPNFAPVQLAVDDFKPQVNGSIYQVGRSVRLFEDSKAFRVGDLLSVTLSESTNASKSAATNTSKSNEVGTSAASVLGAVATIGGATILENAMQGDRKFSGNGDSAQSNSLSGEISVMVVKILGNGNLVIRGEKIIGLNQGAEFIRIAGLVRPQDVSSNNIVMSKKIANARIYYGGGGVVANSNNKGWLARIFDSPIFPL